MSISKGRKSGTKSISKAGSAVSAVRRLWGQVSAIAKRTLKPSKRGKKNKNEWAKLDRYQ